MVESPRLLAPWHAFDRRLGLSNSLGNRTRCEWSPSSPPSQFVSHAELGSSIQVCIGEPGYGISDRGRGDCGGWRRATRPWMGGPLHISERLGPKVAAVI